MALGFLLKRGDFARNVDFFIHTWLIARWQARVEFETIVASMINVILILTIYDIKIDIIFSISSAWNCKNDR